MACDCEDAGGVLCAVEGVPFSATWTALNADGTPLSLASAAVTFRVNTEAGGTNIINLAEGSGVTVSGANNNIISIAIGTSDLAGHVGSHVWQIVALASGATVFPPVRGKFVIKGAV